MSTSIWSSASRGAGRKLTDPLGGPSADPAGASDAVPSSRANMNPFNASEGLENAASPMRAATPDTPQLTTLANFSGGVFAYGNLLIDSAGDLFGEASNGGASGDGEVFELVATGRHYAHPPSVLASFDGADGQGPNGNMIEDSAGDLFGTTGSGGANNDGTVFEIVKTQSGYANTPTTLVSFAGTDGAGPIGGLIADSAGNLFGVTSSFNGTVFEIVKTADGYANTPTTLVNFKGADGATPFGSLTADAAGDLFGTTNGGGANGDGTVFEVVKTQKGYAKTPTTIVSFPAGEGQGPVSGVVMDAAGDLFGMTPFGGASGDGAIFEIVKTGGVYAGAPTTLFSFTSPIGSAFQGSLIIDAAGNLFGTTRLGGADNDGTAFELAKTEGGYASAPTILADFTGANGTTPFGVVANAKGTLFGTTGGGGAKGDGTVFKITGSGFVPPAAPAAPETADVTHATPSAAVFAQAIATGRPDDFGSPHPATYLGRGDTPTLLARPQVA